MNPTETIAAARAIADRIAPTRSIPAPPGTVVAYTRVSTAEQADSRAGLDAQRATITAEAERRGLTIVGWETDAGVSGTVPAMEREGAAAALDAVRTGQAAAVIVAKLDRLGRNVLDLLSTIERAGANGLILCDLDIDTTTPFGTYMLTNLAAHAQLERDMIAQRTRDALAAKKAAGVRLGRPSNIPPRIVRRIVTERAGGAGYKRIADALTDDGVPTAQGGRRWYPATVRKVLAGQDAAKIAAELTEGAAP